MDLKELRQLTAPELAEKVATAHAGTLQPSLSAGDRTFGKPHAGPKDQAVHCQGEDDSA